MPVFKVIGNAFYASGFELNVYAEDSEQARTIAKRMVREGHAHEPRMDDWPPELQEVDVQVIEAIE